MYIYIYIFSSCRIQGFPCSLSMMGMKFLPHQSSEIHTTHLCMKTEKATIQKPRPFPLLTYCTASSTLDKELQRQIAPRKELWLVQRDAADGSMFEPPLPEGKIPVCVRGPIGPATLSKQYLHTPCKGGWLHCHAELQVLHPGQPSGMVCPNDQAASSIAFEKLP